MYQASMSYGPRGKDSFSGLEGGAFLMCSFGVAFNSSLIVSGGLPLFFCWHFPSPCFPARVGLVHPIFAATTFHGSASP